MGRRAGAYLARAIDDQITQQGLEAPREDWPDDLLTSEGRSHVAPTELDLADVGISTVIWAMGYRPDLGWVGLPFLDAGGLPDPAAGGDAGAGALHPRTGLVTHGEVWPVHRASARMPPTSPSSLLGHLSRTEKFPMS